MFIHNLVVKNFRNYDLARLELSEGANIFIGDNAQGKTNLVEAVRFLSIGRSSRTPRDKELIFWGREEARIRADITKNYGTESVEACIRRGLKKQFKVNGMELKRIGELMGTLMTVFFSPDELKIIKGSPEERRRFIDISLSQLKKSYFFALMNYNQILSQRNKYLKSGGKLNRGVLEIWDEQLTREGARIIKSRRGFVRRLSEEAGRVHSSLTDGRESLSVEYVSIEGDSVEEVRENFVGALTKLFEREMALGFTLLGAHKDDLVIKVNGVDVRSFGSQGQQRTAALSLKLAETAIFESETGQMPVILLDDVLSELDQTRQKRLLELSMRAQTIITTTHLDLPVQKARIFRINNGKVETWKDG